MMTYDEYLRARPIVPATGRCKGLPWEQPMDAARWEHERSYDSMLQLAVNRGEIEHETAQQMSRHQQIKPWPQELVRLAGFEPAATGLPDQDSTTELQPE